MCNMLCRYNLYYKDVNNLLSNFGQSDCRFPVIPCGDCEDVTIAVYQKTGDVVLIRYKDASEDLC